MKHFLVSLFTFFIFSGLVVAQDTNPYFVVVENNIYEQDNSIVKIYDEQGQLVYEEYLKGIYIDISLKKHRDLIMEVNELFCFFIEDDINKGLYKGFIGLLFDGKV